MHGVDWSTPAEQSCSTKQGPKSRQAGIDKRGIFVFSPFLWVTAAV